jgi:hypothetical protein
VAQWSSHPPRKEKASGLNLASAYIRQRDAKTNPVIQLRIKAQQTGTDVMIFKIFSPKNLAKKLAFFAQTTASFCKNCDHNIGF